MLYLKANCQKSTSKKYKKILLECHKKKRYRRHLGLKLNNIIFLTNELYTYITSSSTTVQKYKTRQSTKICPFKSCWFALVVHSNRFLLVCFVPFASSSNSSKATTTCSQKRRSLERERSRKKEKKLQEKSLKFKRKLVPSTELSMWWLWKNF